jgi:N-acyl-D-glutamate deacylase
MGDTGLKFMQEQRESLMKKFFKVITVREKTDRMPLAVITLVMLLTSVISSNVFAATFDVVINNGRVMDPETNFYGVRNVGIKDNQIVVITEDAINGKETIDASGHVVAPGFIEGHQHATDPFSRKVNLRDGLTTGMDFHPHDFRH